MACLDEKGNKIPCPPGLKDGTVIYGGGKRATTADSLQIYNHANDAYNFYKNNPNYDETGSKMLTTDSRPMDVLDNKYYAGYANIPYYKRGLFEKDKDLKEKIVYKKDIDKNKFYQREIENYILNPDAPMQLFDRRITPTLQYYFSEHGDGKFSEDRVNVYRYDPILVKPVAMLTPKERAERIKKYGKASGLIGEEIVPDKKAAKKLLDMAMQKSFKPIKQSIDNSLRKEDTGRVTDMINPLGEPSMNFRINSANISSPKTYSGKYTDLNVNPLYDGSGSLMGIPVLLENGNVGLRDNSGKLIQGKEMSRDQFNQFGNSNHGNMKVFKKGGKMKKCEFGTEDPLDPKKPNQLKGNSGMNWAMENNFPGLPNNPNLIKTISNNNNNLKNIVPLSQNVNYSIDIYGNIVPKSTGNYVSNDGKITTLDEAFNKANIASNANLNNADKKFDILSEIDTGMTIGLSAVNKFLGDKDYKKRQSTNLRRGIDQEIFAPVYNPYFQGNGSQAIMKKGGKIESYKNGEILWGGSAKPISEQGVGSNPMFEFVGNTHDEGGIGVKYGKNKAEVEDEEVGWIDNENSLNVFGKLKFPGSNKTFKSVAKDLGMQENKINKSLEKTKKVIDNTDQNNEYYKSALNTAKVMYKSQTNQATEISMKKEQLSDMQNTILSMMDSKTVNYNDYIKFADGGFLDGEGDPSLQEKISFLKKRTTGSSIEKAHPELINRLYRLMTDPSVPEDIRDNLTIASGARTNERQKQIKAQKGKYAASPGNSPHEIENGGIAVDLAYKGKSFSKLGENSEIFKKFEPIAKKFGLARPDRILNSDIRSGEVHHFELIGDNGQTDVWGYSNKKAGNYSLNQLNTFFDGVKENDIYIPGTKTIDPRIKKEYDAYKSNPTNLQNTLEFQRKFHQYYPDKTLDILKNYGVNTNYGIANKLNYLQNVKANEDGLKGPRTDQYMEYLNSVGEIPANYNPDINTFDNSENSDYNNYNDFKNINSYPNTGGNKKSGYSQTYNTPKISDNITISNTNKRRDYQSPLSILQITPELLTLATNNKETNPQLSYQPELKQTFDMSYQLGRNENQSTFNQAAKIAESTGNIGSLYQLAAAKYKADETYNNAEVQNNAQQKLNVYSNNVDVLNDAKLKNLQLINAQQDAMAQTNFNQRKELISSIGSITNKVLKNDLENKTYNAYAGLFPDYGFDRRGNVTFDRKQAVTWTAGTDQAYLAAQNRNIPEKQITKTDGNGNLKSTTSINDPDSYVGMLKDMGYSTEQIKNAVKTKFPGHLPD